MPHNEKEQAQQEFDNTYNNVSNRKEEGYKTEDVAELEKFKSPLGDEVLKTFNDAEKDRQNIEDRMLKDLRQFRGEYDPEVLTRLHPKRSKAFISLTKTKVKTLSARQSDLLFPANGERNWGIEPTPIPELNPQIIENISRQFMEATGEAPEEEFIKKELNNEAVRRCEAMQAEIEDQLAELKYRETIRNVILSGNLYGTGCLKGPLVKKKRVKRWLPNGDEWVAVEIEQMLPYCEFVPVWDLYPDMAARTPEQMRYIFQRYVMNKHKVLELANRSDFNSDAIRAYLAVHCNGNATAKNHEQSLRALNPSGSDVLGYTETSRAGTSALGIGGGSNVSMEGKYEVIEYWGYVNTKKLRDMGVEISKELDIEVAANVWMIGDTIIKAVMSPIEGVTFPYHFYYYEKDDTSIWGEGIPSIMRDPQSIFNAAIRAMLDNAAISAGPLIEVNTELVDTSSEDPRDVYPFRAFLRDGVGIEAQAEAIRVHSLPSYTNEYMAMINFFMTMTDEVTAIPRYLYGETTGMKGAGATASGLSMLMGATNITLKDQIKFFDDGITEPFIKAMYFWNMQFSPKEYIKGDYSVKAKGTTSLIAREVKAESLNQFLAVTNNPTDLMYIKRDNVLREMVKIMDLDDYDFIKDANTVAMEAQARDEEAQRQQAFTEKLATMKAESGGHMDEEEQQARPYGDNMADAGMGAETQEII